MADLISNMLPVLIVDDEARTLQSSRIVLRSAGITNVFCSQNSLEIPNILKEQKIGVLLLDLSMPGLSGEEALKFVKQEYPYIPVIIMTGANDVEKAVQCMQAGAYDYIVKPVEKSRLISGVRRALEVRELERVNILLKERILSDAIENPETFSEIITNNEKMKAVFQYAEAIARTTQPVMITGETGVGKELMARAIHKSSGLAGPFVAVNPAGFEDTLFSDALFGHKKGAYTSADESRSGLVEKADGGTLFLDEIGDLSLPSQVKLLRLIQEREYMPLGSDVVRRSNARILVATNQDLDALMKTGAFRKDLFYRLQTHHIRIPSLRERLDDLPLLVDFFLEQSALSLKRKKSAIHPNVINLLSTYSFPGNIRELQSIIFDAASKSPDDIIPIELFRTRLFGKNQPDLSFKSEIGQTSESPIIFPQTLPAIRDMNRMLIAEAMKRSGGNQSIAARMLGISQQALSRRLKGYED